MSKLIFARHVVAGMFVLMILPHPGEGFLVRWFAGMLIAHGIAAGVTGLAKLFFTEREKGRSASTYVNTMWVIIICVQTGMWLEIWPPVVYVPFVVLLAWGAAKWRGKHPKQVTVPQPTGDEDAFYKDRLS